MRGGSDETWWRNKGNSTSQLSRFAFTLQFTCTSHVTSLYKSWSRFLKSPKIVSLKLKFILRVCWRITSSGTEPFVLFISWELLEARHASSGFTIPITLLCRFGTVTRTYLFLFGSIVDLISSSEYWKYCIEKYCRVSSYLRRVSRYLRINFTVWCKVHFEQNI